MTVANLGWIDSYLPMIVPAFGSALGVYLVVQFMSQLPDAIIEAARIDGASEWSIFWKIIMPQIKPAWITIMIFSVQNLWNLGANSFVYSEDIKTLPYALQQIMKGGVARTGVASAVTVVMMIVPIITFILSQRQVMETMASSGIKD